MHPRKIISCSFSGALPTLAGGLRGVEFAYRTLGKRGVPGPWLYQWERPDALPMQVRVRIADAQGACEQIGDLEFIGPGAQISEVEIASADFENAENITPLALRDFTAQAIPFQFGKDGVFGAGHVDASVGIRCNDGRLASLQLHLVEGAQFTDENVHFEGGFVVDEVEAAVMNDGFSDHSVVGVEFLRERGDQRWDVRQLHVCHDVRVQRGAHDAMQRTGKRAAHCVGAVSYTHLRAHETVLDLVCRLLLEKKKNKHTNNTFCCLQHKN